MEETNELFQSKETTPLLGKREAVGLYSEVTEPAKCTSEPAYLPDPAASGTSRASEQEEVDATQKQKENEDEELAEHISSYEGMADIVTPAVGCGLFYGIWIYACYCLSSFMIQFPLHVLLLSLPIAIGFMGVRYMSQCPMNATLPYSMMVVGGFGILVLLFRLALLLHSKFSTDELMKKWLKKSTKLLECVFLLFFIFELYFSYNMSPSNDPFSPAYCDKGFCNFVSAINNVVITLVVVWIFLYFITGQRCMRRSTPV